MILTIFSYFKSIENKSYIFARFVSVLIKPLLLFICLFFNFEEFGTLIAMVFLVSAMNMMLSGVPIYRNFFIGINSNSESKKRYFKKKYKSEIVIFFFISLVLILPVNLFFNNDFEIYFCSVLIFSIEKIYDEIQRFLIYKKKFYTWSTITNLKNLKLIIFLFNPLMNMNILILSFIYFVINFFKLSKFIKLDFNVNKKKQINQFISSLWKNRNIFLMTYMLLFYNIGDRIVIGKLFPKNLTEYIFLSNILSLPLLTIFYFYISKYRAEFVKNIFDLKGVLLSNKFNYLMIINFSLVIILLLIYYNLNLSNISKISIVLLFIIYLIKSYDLIINEIIYWKKFYKDFLYFEFLFLILFLVLFSATGYFNFSLNIFLLNFLLLFLFKIIFKMRIYLKKNIYIKKLSKPKHK